MLFYLFYVHSVRFNSFPPTYIYINHIYIYICVCVCVLEEMS